MKELSDYQLELSLKMLLDYHSENNNVILALILEKQCRFWQSLYEEIIYEINTIYL